MHKFKKVTENGLTPAEERAIVKAAKEAEEGKNVTKYMSADEAIKYLDTL